MKHATIVALVLLITLLGGAGMQAVTAAEDPAFNGRILFVQHDFRTNGTTVSLIDPDGTNLGTLPAWRGEFYEPRWSPDGSEINMYGDACGVVNQPDCAVVIVDPDTGGYRWLSAPHVFFACTDPCFVGGFGCPIWSPDGSLLGCLGTSETDPGAAGMYTIRSSDGGGLTHVKPFDQSAGWEEFPTPRDFSPDGQRLLYEQTADVQRTGLFLVDLDGAHNHRVSPVGFLTNHDEEASFSPSGRWILFTANADENHRRAVYLIHPDGSGLHKAFRECGGRVDVPGTIGCGNASWSPDGSRIIYFRNAPNGDGTYTPDIISVNLDGTDAQVVVHGSRGYKVPIFPDWGTHQLEP
jgi:Tol biopolymer transport system component